MVDGLEIKPEITRLTWVGGTEEEPARPSIGRMMLRFEREVWKSTEEERLWMWRERTCGQTGESEEDVGGHGDSGVVAVKRKRK